MNGNRGTNDEKLTAIAMVLMLVLSAMSFTALAEEEQTQGVLTYFDIFQNADEDLIVTPMGLSDMVVEMCSDDVKAGTGVMEVRSKADDTLLATADVADMEFSHGTAEAEDGSMVPITDIYISLDNALEQSGEVYLYLPEGIFIVDGRPSIAHTGSDELCAIVADYGVIYGDANDEPLTVGGTVTVNIVLGSAAKAVINPEEGAPLTIDKTEITEDTDVNITIGEAGAYRLEIDFYDANGEFLSAQYNTVSTDISVDADLKSIMEANTYESLSEKYTTIGATLIFYNAQGEIINNYFSSIDNADDAYYHNYLTDAEDYLSDGKLFGNDPENTSGPVHLRVFLADAQFEDYIGWYEDRFFVYGDEEKLIYSEMDDDMLVIATLELLTDDEVESFASYGFEGTTGYEYVYYINPETNIIEKCMDYVVMGDDEALYSEYEFYSSDDVVAEPDYAAQVKACDTRTLTVHVGDETMTFTGYKGYAMRIIAPEGYGVYDTADGQTFDHSETDFNADADVYMLPIEDTAE